MKSNRKYSQKMLSVRLTPKKKKRLEKFLKEEKLYRIALERWENKDDEIITAEEMHKRLEF